MLIYLSIIGTLVLVGVIFLILLVFIQLKLAVDAKGDLSFIVDLQSKSHAKKVADAMIASGFVAKKIEMTEEEAKTLAQSIARFERGNNGD